MRNRDDFRAGPRDVPPVGRPRGAAWRALQADGVVWEGQVFLIGGDVDLAARMIVTHRAVAFARGGLVVLEVPRPWLRPAPVLDPDGTIVLSISPPGASPYTPSERIPFQMRDGHPAAGHVIAMLAGSGACRLPSEVPPGDDFARGMLPLLPETLPSRPEPLAEGWDSQPARFDFGAPRSERPRLVAIDPLADPRAIRAEPEPPPDPPGVLDPVIRQPAPPVATGRDRDWNMHPLFPVRHLVPRSQRRGRWGWALRLGGLFVLLAGAGLVGTGRFPTDLGRFGAASTVLPEATTPSAIRAAIASPPLSSASGAKPPEVAARRTAVAMGVGGSDDPTHTPAPPAVTGAPTVGAAFPAPAAAGSTVAQAAPTAAATNAPSQAPTAGSTASSVTTAEPTPTSSTSSTSSTSQPAAPAVAVQLALQSAQRGTSLPAYGLPPKRSGDDWLALVVDVTNGGGSASATPMDDVRVVSTPGDAPAPLDAGSTAVATIRGISPALGPDDTLSLAPGETKTVVLLFAVPPAADGFALQVGDARLDLGSIAAS